MFLFFVIVLTAFIHLSLLNFDLPRNLFVSLIISFYIVVNVEDFIQTWKYKRKKRNIQQKKKNDYQSDLKYKKKKNSQSNFKDYVNKEREGVIFV